MRRAVSNGVAEFGGDLGRLEYAFVVATEQDLEQAVMEDSSVDMGLVDGRAAEGETP